MQHQQAAIDFTAARVRAETGMDRAQQRAEKNAPGWTDLAIARLRTYAESIYPRGFTMEQARAALAGVVPEPAELRSWGAVTVGARRQRFIEETGQYLPAASSNGSPKREYRAKVVA
jgi:hypothetical protein